MRLCASSWRVKQIEKFLPVPVLDVVVLPMTAVDETLDNVAVVVQDAVEYARQHTRAPEKGREDHTR